MSPDRVPIETSIDIKEGQRGISYSKLFRPYLLGAKKILLVDPFLRYDYQLQNLVSFCECISPSEGNVSLQVLTSAEVKEQEQEISAKLSELQQNLVTDGVLLEFKFDTTIHDRLIETDNGWRITLGRGLEIFQKPEGRLTLGFVDQTKRKCKATSLIYTKRQKGDGKGSDHIKRD